MQAKYQNVQIFSYGPQLNKSEPKHGLWLCLLHDFYCMLLPKDAFLTQAIVSQNLPELGIEPRSLSQLLHEKVFFFQLLRLCFISYAESIYIVCIK